jgi:hypothetical protein
MPRSQETNLEEREHGSADRTCTLFSCPSMDPSLSSMLKVHKALYTFRCKPSNTIKSTARTGCCKSNYMSCVLVNVKAVHALKRPASKIPKSPDPELSCKHSIALKVQNAAG